MRRIVIGLLSVAAMLSAVDLAQARDGCGPGRYYNGYRCAPMGGPGPGYGGPGFYGPGPGYGGGPYRGGGRGIYFDRNGQPACAQRGFTVQDGVCKPYRGF